MKNAASDRTSDAGDPRIWAAYFRLHLCDLRPDLAPAEAGRLATDAWDAACLLQPLQAAELVAIAIDRRDRDRRSTPLHR